MEQWLKPLEFYSDNNIDLLLGVRIDRIDPQAKRVYLGNGEHRGYGTVVIATGATPRMIPVPGADADGALTLRTLTDARRLGTALGQANALAVIGGGYVGMEVAAVARSRGIDVTVIEREERMLARVASAELSRRLTEYHISQGTRVVTGGDVVGFETANGAVSAVALRNGTAITCDYVLTGIGATPNVELARQCGVACDGGILVDRVGRTNVPGIMAIGDVTRRPHDDLDGLRRLESIPSAVEQAKHAASWIVGEDIGTHETPWFWSDQFDLKLKMAGLLEDGAHTITRSGAGSEAFALFHLRPDRTLCAVETANSPKEFMAGKKMIADRLPIDPTLLADDSVPLRDVMTAAKAGPTTVATG